MTTTQAIDLQPFCATESSRYPIEKPFVKGCWLSATNGVIVARIPSNEKDDIPPHGKFPNVASVFATRPENANRKPLTFTEVLGDVNCKCRHDCATCKGNGTTECETCGHEESCDSCYGKGWCCYRKCNLCDGNGTVRGVVRAKISGREFDWKYIEMIRDLPELTVHLKGDALWFWFAGGGEGCLMAVSKE